MKLTKKARLELRRALVRAEAAEQYLRKGNVVAAKHSLDEATTLLAAFIVRH